jgi:hypothetical protein
LPWATVAGVAAAQAPDTVGAEAAELAVQPSFGDRFVARNAMISITLSRPLTSADGEIAIVIGTSDLTAFFVRDGTRFTYRPRPIPLPSGEHLVTVYRIAGGRWTELARLPLRVLTAGGFTKATAGGSLAINNKGQLAEGRSAGLAAPERRTFQDFSMSTGVRTSLLREGWSAETQSNYVGVSRREEALRFGVERDAAPRIDLADYVVGIRAGPAALSIGQVSIGGNRHLASGFASRGVTLALGRPGVSLALGSVNGSSVVGWSNVFGLNEPRHRMSSATLGVELVPSRAGAMHVELAALDGSLLPVTGIAQGAVVDAEQSDGAGIQVSATTPGQRLRLAGGYTRSRFVNPARDPQLGGATLVPARRETHGARFVELGVALLQNRRLGKTVTSNAALAVRHERIDPLYRSVAAFAQADREQNGVDLTGNIGPLQAQLSHNWSGDNLAHVPSVLTSLTRASTGSLALPLATLVRARTHAGLWPTLTYALNRTHQLADELPPNGDFRPVDLPDQMNTVHDAGAQWIAGRWRVAYRFNRSVQDNRQPGRERSDFSADVHSVSLGTSVGATMDASLDLSRDAQRNRELSQQNLVRRAGLSLAWRPDAKTSLGANVTTSVTRDDPRTSRATNGEYRAEASRTIALRRPPSGRSDGGTSGQLFLRYARTAASARRFTVPIADAPLAPRTMQAQWSLASGLTLRVF